MYETFEHTADLGLRIRADDLNTLFAEAGRALFSALVDNLDDVQPRDSAEFEISGSEHDYLLFDWLNELLYRYEIEKLLFSKFAVNVGNDGLTARAAGETADESRHRLSHEIKAITYHELKVEQIDGQWQATVIVDI